MSNDRGFTLVEVLVAVVLLELAIVAAFGGVLLAERLRRDATMGALIDAARWEAWQMSQAAPSCLSGPASTVPLMFPATTLRPPLNAVISCGR